MDLFSTSDAKRKESSAPLAWRMRPSSLDEVVGQEHIVGQGSPLRRAIEKDSLHSFVLYGPPGTGKTSIARIIARMTNSHFEYLQAVTTGVSDIRKVAIAAEDRRKYYQQQTVLFVDEIHRFNKGQQDVLLPFVEDGTLILIGATTENPLYELNNALLSRMKLYILEALEAQDITQIVNNALKNSEKGLGNLDIQIDKESMAILIQASQGDARTALNILDTLNNSYTNPDGHLAVNAGLLKKITGKLIVKYDRSGDYHYDTISAFIKSIRGSDPDAALYWMAVMLEGGEDPKYIARRLIVHAAEDIGLADPNALTIATSAASAVQYVGLPEARIPLAEATIYLCTAPKSNSSKVAIDEALAAVRSKNRVTVPSHIADTSHSQAGQKLGKGKGYKYPHDFGGYVEQTYLPDELGEVNFYHPSNNGYENTIQKFLEDLPNKK
ncbi:MAG TPA: replication-associated recombination protein A [Syntrophomonas sp.]|nr:replication-associated recombination protein A [Syntrophomonas sp.]